MEGSNSWWNIGTEDDEQQNRNFSGGGLKLTSWMLDLVKNLLHKTSAETFSFFFHFSLRGNLRKSHPPLLLSNGCTHLGLSGILLFLSTCWKTMNLKHQTLCTVWSKKAFFLTSPDDLPDHNHSFGPAKSGMHIPHVLRRNTHTHTDSLHCPAQKTHPVISSESHPNSAVVPKSCCYFYSTRFPSITHAGALPRAWMQCACVST